MDHCLVLPRERSQKTRRCGGVRDPESYIAKNTTCTKMRIFNECMTSDRKLKASREGSKGRNTGSCKRSSLLTSCHRRPFLLAFNLCMLVYLVICDSGWVSLEHLLPSWYPSQNLLAHLMAQSPFPSRLEMLSQVAFSIRQSHPPGACTKGVMMHRTVLGLLY